MGLSSHQCMIKLLDEKLIRNFIMDGSGWQYLNAFIHLHITKNVRLLISYMISWDIQHKSTREEFYPLPKTELKSDKTSRSNCHFRENQRLGGASLVAQWLRVCLPMQGTRVRALVWEDPTCHGATGPVSHNCWACASGACAPQQERPRRWEARAPRWRVAPAHHN